MENIPIRYLPFGLSNTDTAKQKTMLRKSKKLYRTRKFYTRKHLSSYHNKPSRHLANARRLYDVEKVSPNQNLAKATGCKISALQQIVSKGEGSRKTYGYGHGRTRHRRIYVGNKISSIYI